MKVRLQRTALMGLSAALALAALACIGSAKGDTPPTLSPDIYAPIPTPRPFGRIPTSTPPSIPLPFPTATATSEPLPTVIGAPGDPPGETPSPTTAVPATSTPSAAPTMGPEPTATPEPTQTPAPTATATPTQVPAAPGGLVYQAETGEIAHDPDHSAPDEFRPDVYVSDFSVSATFRNPFHATFRPFSYGMKFRDDGETYHVLAINSEGEVLYYLGTPDGLSVMKSFPYMGIQTAGGGSNSLRLTVVDTRAWLFVNDEFLGEFQVGGQDVQGDVALVAEVLNESLVYGAATVFTELQIRQAGLAASIPEGSLVKAEGEISRTAASAAVRDSTITARFISPYEVVLGNWSVGFEFTEPLSGTTNWLVFDNRLQWKHYRRAGSGGEVELVASGQATGLKRDRADVNELLLLGSGGAYTVFLNGTMLTTVMLDMQDLPAQVSVIAGFGPDDQPVGAPTRFMDYQVWSLGG